MKTNKKTLKTMTAIMLSAALSVGMFPMTAWAGGINSAGSGNSGDILTIDEAIPEEEVTDQATDEASITEEAVEKNEAAGDEASGESTIKNEADTEESASEDSESEESASETSESEEEASAEESTAEEADEVIIQREDAGLVSAANKRYTSYTADKGSDGCWGDGKIEYLVDNNLNSKWGADLEGTKYVEFHSAEPISPVGYILITGKDTAENPHRNPKSWNVYGKVNASDTQWTCLDAVTNSATPEAKNLEPYTYMLTNPDLEKSWQYFRYEVTESREGTHIQLAEFQFLIEDGQGGEDPELPAVASVTKGSTTTGYSNFDAALQAWNSEGAGATLKLLDNVSTNQRIDVNGGTANNPMVLDLNGHGILSDIAGYDMTGGTLNRSVVYLPSGSHLQLKDSSSQTRNYITIDENKRGIAAGNAAPSDGSEYIEVTGGFITGGNQPQGYGCGLYVSRNAGVEMGGGNICGNFAGFEGGVRNEGTFVLSEGKICNNKTLSEGGGVYNNGYFTMYGGEISGNISSYVETPHGVVDGKGGGVYNNATFTMYDGKICNNSCESSNGGAVFNKGTFTIDSGEISGNSAFYGGGIYVDASQVIINGGKISGNTASSKGGGVYVYGGSLTLGGGVICANTAPSGKNIVSPYGASVSVIGGIVAGAADDGSDRQAVFISDFLGHMGDYGYITVITAAAAGVSFGDGAGEYYQDIRGAVADWKNAGPGAVLYLLSDVTITSTIEAVGGSETAHKVLDLNDHGIIYTGEDGSVISIAEGAFLDLIDSAPRTTRYILLDDVGRGTEVSETVPSGDRKYAAVTGGYITGGKHKRGGSGVSNLGSFTFNSGNICGNVTTGSIGGGVDNMGDFLMNGGRISHNTAFYGGGISSNGAFTIKGGEIIKNNALDYGGGVYTSFDNFTFENGKISENTAPNGGGVYVSGGMFILNGGEISGNTSTRDGGGCFLRGKAELNSGVIKDNTCENDGGGIYVYDVTRISGTVISGNKAKNGGGIAVGMFVLELKGGLISGNTATADGGGIHNEDRTIISGGTIRGNTAARGGGIFNTNGHTIELSGVEIANNTADSGPAIGFDNNGTGLTFNGEVYAGVKADGTDSDLIEDISDLSKFLNYGYISVEPPTDDVACVISKDGTQAIFKKIDRAAVAWNAAGDGATLKLLGDALSLKGIWVNHGTESDPMVLDLNDHGIIYKGDENTAVINVEAGKHFVLKDSSSAQTEHYITLEGERATTAADTAPSEGTEYIKVTGGYIGGGFNACNDLEMSYGGGGIFNGGTTTMLAGTICGNVQGHTELYALLGAGIMNNGIFVLEDGEISHNYSMYGAGIFNGADATFTMNGGRICNNHSTRFTGSVFDNGGTFKMCGGEISGNTPSHIYHTSGTFIFEGEVFVSEGGSALSPISKEQAVKEIEKYDTIIVRSSEGATFTYDKVEVQKYTGSAIKPDVNVYYDRKLLTKNKDYTISYSNNVNVGEAQFIITGKGNYSGKATGFFAISQKPLTDRDLVYSKVSSRKFNNKTYTPGITITHNKKKLVLNRDYEVKYFISGNISTSVTPKEAGRYMLTVQGLGNYGGLVHICDFYIYTDGQVPVDKLSISKIPDQQYTGRGVTPRLTVKDGKTILTEGSDYTLTFYENIAVGKGTVKLECIGEKYCGYTTLQFNIVTTSLKKVKLSGFASSMAYTDGLPKTQNIKLTHKLNGENRELRIISKSDFDSITNPNDRLNWDCTAEYTNNVEIGTATMTITGINGYYGTIVKSFKITGTAISKAKVEGFEKSFAYDKAVKIQDKLVLKYKNVPLTKDDDYTVEYTDNTDIGTATMIVTGKGRFFGTMKKTFKITGGTAISKAKIEGFVASAVYTGSEITQTGVTLSYNGTPLEYGEDKDYTISYEKNDKAGTATMIVKGRSYWYGSVKKKFKIAAFDISKNEGDKITITLDAPEYYYAKSGAKPEPVVKFGDTVLTKGTDYTVSYANNTAINDGTGSKVPVVKITGKGNFTKTNADTTFKIVASDMQNAGITLKFGTTVYKNAAGNWKNAVTVVEPDGKKLSLNKDYKVFFTYDQAGLKVIDDKAQLQAGNTVYVIVTACQGSNYTGELTGSYKIYRYDIGKLNASVDVKEYTGQEITLDPADITWKLGKETVTDVDFAIDATTYTQNINKGKATVVVNGTGDCVGSKKVTFNIGTKDIFWWWLN